MLKFADESELNCDLLRGIRSDQRTPLTTFMHLSWARFIPRIISLWLCQYLAMLAYGVSRDAGKQCAAACDGSQYLISIYGGYLSA